MIRPIALLSLGLALLAPYARVAAQPATAPSVTAVQLAAAIPPSSSVFLGSPDLKQTEDSIMRELLQTVAAWLGPGCDWDSDPCKAGARDVARRYAPIVVKDAQDTSRQLYARLFDSLMSPSEREDALRFASTPSGRSFLAALAFGANPYADPERFRTIAKGLARKQSVSERAMLEAFYAATRRLPRRYHVVVAPPQPATAPSQQPKS